jgi:glycosyltransferase involved in cell wall biosynthesis
MNSLEKFDNLFHDSKIMDFDVPFKRRDSADELHPRLCIVGPMVGKNPGYVTSQGEIISDLLAHDGYQLTSASSAKNRYARLADIVATIMKNRHKIDILVINVYGGRSFVVEDVASQLGSRYGFGIIMMLHGGAMPNFMARFPGWTKRVLSKAHILCAPSAYLARALRVHGFDCRIVPNIVDVESYPYRHRQRVGPHLFWMRTFHPVYNPAMAIKVLAELRSVLPQATLVMAGQDKGHQEKMKELAKSLGVGDAIRFAGFLEAETKRHEGNLADIFISTNHVDNMPVAVVEAGAMGLPVISTSVGGVPDLLTQNETGLLVPDNDVTGMVNAICRLVLDQDLAGRLSENGRRLAEKSSWNEVRLHWDEMFSEIMARPNKL